jgi:hypothetical protein
LKLICSLISIFIIGMFFYGCVSVSEPSQETIDNQKDMTQEDTFGASHPTAIVNPVTDEEILTVKNAIARAEEIEADNYYPDHMKLARDAFDEALALRTTEPEKTRILLAHAKEKADDTFTMTVKELAATCKKRLDDLFGLLADIEADKYAANEYRDFVSRMEEVDNMFEERNVNKAVLLAEKTEEKMRETYERLDEQITLVIRVKQNAEKGLEEAEKSEAYMWVEETYMLAHECYFAGISAFQNYHLDEAEESFRHTEELCHNMVAETEIRKRKHAIAVMKAGVLDMLQEAAGLTVITGNKTLIRPQPFDREAFLNDIDINSEDIEKTGEDTYFSNDDPEIPVASEEIPVENLLNQSKELIKQGIIEEKRENYTKAEQLFKQAKEYLTRYICNAVQTIYTVRYLPGNRDCLWKIAGYDFIYGNPFLWPLIWRRNRNLIKNPRFIYPGQLLIIPLKPVQKEKED